MSSERRWKTIGLVLLAVIALLMLATVRDFGLTWDEDFHSTYGEYVLAWFESGFNDVRALDFKNSYIYGALFDVIAQLFARLSPLGLYEDRHLVTVASEHTDGRVAARRRQVFGKNARQDEPDPVRHALIGFRAHRAVEKVFFVGREVRRRFLAEELGVNEEAGRDEQHRDDQPDQTAARRREPGHGALHSGTRAAARCERRASSRASAASSSTSGTKKTKSK